MKCFFLVFYDRPAIIYIYIYCLYLAYYFEKDYEAVAKISMKIVFI